MANTPEPPIHDAIVEFAEGGVVTWSWLQWFLGLNRVVAQVPQQLRRVTQALQTAAVSTTPIPLPALATGLYRVSYHARITQPATTSSSLTVTIGYTDGGVSCTVSGAAMVGNTTNTVQSGTLLVRCDQATPITYSTAYASVGATPMAYALDVLVESL